MTPPSATTTEPHTRIFADLRQALRLRLFEEKVRELRLGEHAVGSIHLGIGQEAIPIGTCACLEPEDAVFATYRGHNWALACGAGPSELFAEILGRSTGTNGGRGGSAYLSVPEVRFFGENSIVGAGAPIAVGAALAGRFDGTGRVAISVFGDGAMNQGAVHEAMNMAAAMRLPVIFVCENNGWSELTAIDEMVADAELFRRAAAYGMNGQRIAGNDPAVVRATVEGAIAAARAGEGPHLIEAVTARLVGHYIGDAEQYRRPGELERAREQEPIAVLVRQLRELGVGESELADAEATASEEIDAAARWALEQPLADPSTAKDHIYA